VPDLQRVGEPAFADQKSFPVVSATSGWAAALELEIALGIRGHRRDVVETPSVMAEVGRVGMAGSILILK